jgi:valine dehydrogenase (NAD+)
MNLTINNDSTAAEVAQILLSNHIDKVIIANLNNKIVCSHPEALFLIPVIKSSDEWREHEAVMLKVDEQTQCIYIASINSTKRGRAEGGVRLLDSSNFLSGLNDCLALSYGMTNKNAYADIWEGGAKSVIIPYNKRVFDLLMKEKADSEKETIGLFRELLWRNYGGFVSEMQGIYLVGEDMNLNSWDMRCILKYTVHSSCHSKLVGGADNPSPKTAKGIFKAMLATCEIMSPESPEIKNKRIILKGAGLVGESLAKQLSEAGANLIIYDTNPKAKEKNSHLKNVEWKIIERNADESNDTYLLRFKKEELEFLSSIEADIFSPNAKSGTITKELVEVLKVKAIAGAENAQIAKMEEAAILQQLHEKGIIYIPEQCINYMGVYCAYQEHRGILYSEIDEKAEEIYNQTKELLEKSGAESKKPFDIYIEKATAKAQEQNPIDNGHRGIKIIEELVKEWSPEKKKGTDK